MIPVFPVTHIIIYVMKIRKSTKYLSVFLMMILCMASASAARPVVKARLDSAGIVMGRMTNLIVTVEQGKDARGHLELFARPNEKGYVGVCGDSVELRYPTKIDALKDGNGLTITCTVPVQSFDSGSYQLPRIAFVSGVDTSFSNHVALKVMPVANVKADTPIDDYANVADPENKSIFDTLPDWIVNYWWLWLILIALIAAAIILYRRFKTTGHILPPKPEPTPYEVAVRDLAELKGKKLWENGMEKEYFTELTDILRVYLYKRFGINAVEMTSREILSSLSSRKETKDKRKMVRQILDMADFVKFAKVRPLPADNIASFDNALKFVEETKPVAVVEKEDGHDGATSSETSADKAVMPQEEKGGEK